MKIIEYEKKYEEDVKDLLVELEECIVSIDEDNLDQIGKDYREKMLWYDLEEIKNNNGKCFIAVQDNKAVGMVMGIIRKYEEKDRLDYKCPKMGRILELIVTNKVRNSGIGHLLIEKMENYFKSVGCDYIGMEVFAYNKNAIKFYDKCGYHPRMIDEIKKIDK